MFRRIENQSKYDSFGELVKHLKECYRRTHPGETEGLHYQFNERCLADGRSGFLKVERLEAPAIGPTPHVETILIEGNRVVGHNVEDPPPEGVELLRWLE